MYVHLNSNSSSWHLRNTGTRSYARMSRGTRHYHFCFGSRCRFDSQGLFSCSSCRSRVGLIRTRVIIPQKKMLTLHVVLPFQSRAPPSARILCQPDVSFPGHQSSSPSQSKIPIQARLKGCFSGWIHFM